MWNNEFLIRSANDRPDAAASSSFGTRIASKSASVRLHFYLTMTPCKVGINGFIIFDPYAYHDSYPPEGYAVMQIPYATGVDTGPCVAAGDGQPEQDGKQVYATGSQSPYGTTLPQFWDAGSLSADCGPKSDAVFPDTSSQCYDIVGKESGGGMQVLDSQRDTSISKFHIFGLMDYHTNHRGFESIFTILAAQPTVNGVFQGRTDPTTSRNYTVGTLGYPGR